MEEVEITAVEEFIFWILHRAKKQQHKQTVVTSCNITVTSHELSFFRISQPYIYSADGRLMGEQWTMKSGEEDAAPRAIQNALTDWERTIKWRAIYTS